MSDKEKMSIVALNASKDPSFRPYCMRCSGLQRMSIVESMFWRCPACGAEHDERAAIHRGPRFTRGARVRDSFVAAADALNIEHPETPAWDALPAHVQEMYCRIGDAVAGSAVDDVVFEILRNVGVDTNCGACMCQAFTGSNGYEHTCGKSLDVIVKLEREHER